MRRLRSLLSFALVLGGLPVPVLGREHALPHHESQEESDEVRTVRARLRVMRTGVETLMEHGRQDAAQLVEHAMHARELAAVLCRGQGQLEAPGPLLRTTLALGQTPAPELIGMDLRQPVERLRARAQANGSPRTPDAARNRGAATRKMAELGP